LWLNKQTRLGWANGTVVTDADFERCDNDENSMPILTVYSSQENGDEEQGMNEFCDSIATALFNMRG
jgi:hypothetical protein